MKWVRKQQESGTRRYEPPWIKYVSYQDVTDSTGNRDICFMTTPITFGSSQTEGWMWSCSCDLHHSSQQHQLFNSLSEARDQTYILMDTNLVLNLLRHDGNPRANILSYFIITFFFFRAAPAAYGSSQARGQIRAAATGLCHSHSNVGLSCVCDLQWSLRQGRLLNPLSKTRDRTHILMDNTSQVLNLLSHSGNSTGLHFFFFF